MSIWCHSQRDVALQELVNIETLEVDLHGDYRWAIKWSVLRWDRS